MIYVTHDQVEAMTLGDRIAVFNHGRIEQLGTPMALYQQPANEFVAGFLGTPRINLVERPAEGATGPHRALWERLLPQAPAGAQRVGLRPEHLRVAASDDGVPAAIALAEHLGDATILHLRVEGLAELLRAKLGPGHGDLAAGQVLGL